MIDKLGTKATRVEISTIKLTVAKVLLDKTIKVHGRLGMTNDTVLASLWSHKRAARIYDGADEVHKVSLAKQILKRHGNKRSHFRYRD